jgi:hypothetical protein
MSKKSSITTITNRNKHMFLFIKLFIFSDFKEEKKYNNNNDNKKILFIVDR